jgi:hypothetical protein
VELTRSRPIPLSHKEAGVEVVSPGWERSGSSERPASSYGGNIRRVVVHPSTTKAASCGQLRPAAFAVTRRTCHKRVIPNAMMAYTR